MKFEELYQLAQEHLRPVQLNTRVKVGSTVCVLESASGKLFCGKNLVAACGLGYCAEQAAITEMLDRGECVIRSLLVLDHDGTPLPPCGRCLELITQINDENFQSKVLLGKDKTVTVEKLYPLDWKRVKAKIE